MVAPPAPQSDLITVEQFLYLLEDGQKADLIDGVIYMASPDTSTSDKLADFLHRLLGGYCEVSNLGRVFGSRFAFILTPYRAPEPDIAVVRRERLHLVRELGMDGGPDIAIEIVSRDSRSRDYREKKQFYQEAGVTEYWLIDPIQRRAEFYRLVEGRYELVPFEQNRIFRSTALEGFWLDVEWLWQEPLPLVEEVMLDVGGEVYVRRLVERLQRRGFLA
jgi:Uma2 family endonuclease